METLIALMEATRKDVVFILLYMWSMLYYYCFRITMVIKKSNFIALKTTKVAQWQVAYLKTGGSAVWKTVSEGAYQFIGFATHSTTATIRAMKEDCAVISQDI